MKLVNIFLLVLSMFCLTAFDNMTVSVAWDNNTNPNIAGYKLHYDDKARTTEDTETAYANIIDVGRVFIMDLDNSTFLTSKTYYFSLTSYDSTGKDNPLCEEISWNPFIENGKPVTFMMGTN